MLRNLRTRAQSVPPKRASTQEDAPKPVDLFDLKVVFEDNAPHITCSKCNLTGKLCLHGVDPCMTVRCTACAQKFSGSMIRELFDSTANKEAIAKNLETETNAPGPTADDRDRNISNPPTATKENSREGFLSVRHVACCPACDNIGSF